MEIDILKEYLDILPDLKPKLKLAWPLNFQMLGNVNFEPFGLNVGGYFNTSWVFTYNKPSSSSGSFEIQAIVSGVIRVKHVTSQNNDITLLQTSATYPGFMLDKISDAYPSWFPQYRIIEYQNLDRDSVREAVVNLLQDSDSLVLPTFLLNNPDLGILPADQIASLFLDPANEIYLPVFSGMPIGQASSSNEHTAVFRLAAKENEEDSYFLNPAFLFKAFSEKPKYIDVTLLSADIKDKMLDISGPILSTGNMLTVSKSSTAGTFTRLSLAVSSAQPGDTILVESGVYQDGTVIQIDKPLVIMGTAPGNALAEVELDFPKLEGHKPNSKDNWHNQARGVFKLEAVNKGVIQIANLHIKNGTSKQGGGIFVDECHNVWIDNCLFTDNESFSGGWLLEGFGGAICARHSGIVITNSKFTSNKSNSRGGAVGIFGYGWPIISNCAFSGNQATRLNVKNPLNPVSDPYYKSRPDGGALALQMATPKKLYESDFNFTFYLANKNESEFEEEKLRNFAITSMPGAAIAYVFGSSEGSSESKGKLIKEYAIQKLHIEEKYAQILGDLAAGSVDSYWDFEQIRESYGNAVSLIGCNFQNNDAADDGGAIYATGLVQVKCKNLTVKGNKSGANGGGIRISTSCSFEINDSAFEENESNSQKIGYLCGKKEDEKAKEWKWSRIGGGGLAVRNSNLVLNRVQVRNNRAHRFAGGGIYFISTDEGAIQGGAQLDTNWNTIREIIERDPETKSKHRIFQKYSLSISDCTIENNYSGWSSGDVPRPHPASTETCGDKPAKTLAEAEAMDTRSAKGGGIYALRYQKDGVAYNPIEIVIESGSVFNNNHAAFTENGADAIHLFIADLTKPEPNNPAADSRDLSLAGTVLSSNYSYKS